MSFKPYNSKRGSNGKDQFSFQTKIVLAFLPRYSGLHGLPCSRRRAIYDTEDRRYLPSGYLKKDIDAAYESQWRSISTGASEDFDDDPTAKNDLTIQNVLHVWRLYLLHLRIASGGRDYCDYFISISNLKILSGKQNEKI